jgi:hypothetical protein
VRPSHATEQAAAAAAALQRLDYYLMLLDELLRSPDDTHLYARSSDTFDAMRGLTASLPQVRVCWVEVLISRFELLDAAGRSERRRDADEQLAALHQRHVEALEHFRRLCWSYISSNLGIAPRAEGRPCELAPETLLQGAERRVLESERRVEQQHELIRRLEARGADVAAARRVLRSMENALQVMHSNLSVARERQQ